MVVVREVKHVNEAARTGVRVFITMTSSLQASRGI